MIPHRCSAVAAVAAALLAVGLASPALAHASLVSSTPADHAVLSAPPAAITLTFDDELDPVKSSFTVSGGGATGTGRVTPADLHVMTLASPPETAGPVQVRWTAAATDGDITRGTLSFTVSPAATASPSATTTGAAPPSTSPTASPSASSGRASSAAVPPSPTLVDPVAAASPGDVVLPIAIALLLVGAVGAYLLARGRRRA